MLIPHLMVNTPEPIKPHHVVLNVTLQHSERKILPPQGFLESVFGGDREVAQESIDQACYLHQIYRVFSTLGYGNVLLMVVNNQVVYKDVRKQPGDFEHALRLALQAQVQDDFDVAFALDKDEDGRPDFAVKFHRVHDTGEYPLRIVVLSDRVTPQELADLEAQLRRHFEVASIAVATE